MPPADERVQAATSRSSEVSQHGREEWEELLQILKLADSPVGEAIHWFKSRGYGARFWADRKDDMVGKRRKVCELWRFVPELLASEVVYIEEEEEKTGAGTMGSCIWMQTLSNALQTNILNFLNVEHSHFRSKDLEALARRILQCPMEADLWVLQAANVLLQTSSQDTPLKLAVSVEEQKHFRVQDAEMADYYKLPEWLDRYREDSASMFSWLPLEHSVDFQEVPQVHDKSHRPGAGEPSQPDIGVATMELQHVKEPIHEPSECDTRAAFSPGKLREESVVGEDIPDTKILRTEKHMFHTSKTGVELCQGDEKVRAEDDNNARAFLGEDLYLQALSLGRALHSSRGPGLPEEIKLIRSTPKFASLLSVARAWEVDDEVTFLLVGSLLAEQDGYAWSTQVLQTIILPKLFAMEKPASRILVTAVTQAGKIHPRAVMDSVVFPLICSRDGASAVQCELLNRIVKDCLPDDLILSLLQKMFATCADKNHEVSSGHSWKWTEGMVGVVQNLLSYKVNLDEQSIVCLVKALDVVAAEFSKSLKFGNLLLNLVTKHGPRVKSYRGLLQQVAGKSQTFLTKSVQAKLAAI